MSYCHSEYEPIIVINLQIEYSILPSITLQLYVHLIHRESKTIITWLRHNIIIIVV